MKKVILFSFLLLSKLSTFSQIKEIKVNGFSLNIYDAKGNRTGGHTIVDYEKYLGHNSTYLVIQKLNSLVVYDNKGNEYSRPISFPKNRSFVKITEKSIWIKENGLIYYFDFKGDRLSNYKE